MKKLYWPGLVLLLIGRILMCRNLSIVPSILFSIGFILIVFSYADMWSPKHKDPFKYL